MEFGTIFFAAPIEKEDLEHIVRERLSKFLVRAFRRPVNTQTLDRYSEFVMSEMNQGELFSDAMKLAASAVISSPKFLYHYDDATDGKSLEPLTDWELASRLSMFFWGSIPDEELLRVAGEGRLHEDTILCQQVDRMLRDPKLKRFCDSFPAQWMQLERIISSVPDPKQYPDFYFAKYRNSMHMMMEPLLLFEAVLIENRPITDFLDSSFTYRSGHLIEAYGVSTDGLDQTTFRKGGATRLTFVRMPIEDRRYGGLITNAAVMTMTSGSKRTKPITRGAWLATVIFNDPPDPPPADVPPLEEEHLSGENRLTLRERLSKHRERSDCRGCHEQIDPLGFALENFDAVGRWRDKYENGRAVDMGGTLFRKHEFSDVAEFKEALLAEKDRFTRGFVKHLLSFALAREVESSDANDIEMIARETAAVDYRIQTLLKQIVLSRPFRQKYNPTHSPIDR